MGERLHYVVVTSEHARTLHGSINRNILKLLYSVINDDLLFLINYLFCLNILIYIYIIYIILWMRIITIIPYINNNKYIE